MIVILLLRSIRLVLLCIVPSNHFRQLCLCNTVASQGGLPRPPRHHVLALLRAGQAAVDDLPQACAGAPPDAHTDAVLTLLLDDDKPERYHGQDAGGAGSLALGGISLCLCVGLCERNEQQLGGAVCGVVYRPFTTTFYPILHCICRQARARSHLECMEVSPLECGESIKVHRFWTC